MTQKPYIDYRFFGVHSFISTLDTAGTDYRLFDDDYAQIFIAHGDMLKPGEDTLRSGIVTRDDQTVFFSEFALKLTKNFFAHIVFIFNHHPTMEDLDAIVKDLERIVMENMEKIDINRLAEALDEQAGRKTPDDKSSIN